MEEAYNGKERRASPNLGDIILLINDKLDGQHKANKDLLELKFNHVERVLDGVKTELAYNRRQQDKNLEEAIQERKRDFRDLKEEVFKKVETLEGDIAAVGGNIEQVSGRVNLLEDKDGKEALAQKKMLKDEILKWFIVGGIGAVVIIIMHWIVTGVFSIFV